MEQFIHAMLLQPCMKVELSPGFPQFFVTCSTNMAFFSGGSLGSFIERYIQVEPIICRETGLNEEGAIAVTGCCKGT